MYDWSFICFFMIRVILQQSFIQKKTHLIYHISKEKKHTMNLVDSSINIIRNRLYLTWISLGVDHLHFTVIVQRSIKFKFHLDFYQHKIKLNLYKWNYWISALMSRELFPSMCLFSDDLPQLKINTLCRYCTKVELLNCRPFFSNSSSDHVIYLGL